MKGRKQENKNGRKKENKNGGYKRKLAKFQGVSLF